MYYFCANCQRIECTDLISQGLFSMGPVSLVMSSIKPRSSNVKNITKISQENSSCPLQPKGLHLHILPVQWADKFTNYIYVSLNFNLIRCFRIFYSVILIRLITHLEMNGFLTQSSQLAVSRKLFTTENFSR